MSSSYTHMNSNLGMKVLGILELTHIPSDLSIDDLRTKIYKQQNTLGLIEEVFSVSTIETSKLMNVFSETIQYQSSWIFQCLKFRTDLNKLPTTNSITWIDCLSLETPNQVKLVYLRLVPMTQSIWSKYISGAMYYQVEYLSDTLSVSLFNEN